jgi:hypothetical protein
MKAGNVKTYGTASALLFLIGSAAALADTPPNCSLATLHGTYAGDSVHPKNSTTVATVDVESYDGHGHVKYYQQISFGGVSHTTWSGTGTYTVGPLTDTSSGVPITESCVAFIHYDGDPADQIWNGFLSSDGSVVYFVNLLDLGSVSAGHESRISTALLVK